MKSKTIVIVPARYGSTRLPAKPLLDRTGKPLIQHVVESIARARKIDQTVVATDDRRILRAVEAFGGKCVMTSVACRTGTDRLAQAAGKLKLTGRDVVINVQGDEPEMPAKLVDLLSGLMKTTDAPMATLATPLPTDQATNPNKVKVVVNRCGEAMYFSRSPIPFDRDGAGGVEYLLHLGIYAYRVEFLRKFTKLRSTPAENFEKLEQLRALEYGHKIAVAKVNYHGVGIDTPEDYDAFVRRFSAKR